MQTAEIVQTLEAEGVTLELLVRAKGELTDTTRALILENRDDLITLLALRYISGSDYYFNITTSSGKVYVMAKPHHIDEAVSLYPWGVVYDSKDRVITTWGDVPEDALKGKRDLVTGKVIAEDSEQTIVEAENLISGAA